VQQRIVKVLLPHLIALTNGVVDILRYQEERTDAIGLHRVGIVWVVDPIAEQFTQRYVAQHTKLKSSTELGGS
jgi:hypothetical protein